MNGILIVNKPAKMTSFDVVAVLRKILKIKKIGHTGTLDPDAKGVLPVCIGRATSFVEYLIDKDKAYKAILKLGISTDTGDASGKHLSSKSVECTSQEIKDAVMSFEGKIKQIPPMYSALKVGGEKLCNLARRGIVIERQARDIEIKKIEIIKIEDSLIEFFVECSKGTYIRTLCEDIGNKLGCGAHMFDLLRTSSGKFDISDGFSLEQIETYAKNGQIIDKILPVEKGLEEIPQIILDDNDGKKFLNGVFIRLNSDKYKQNVGKLFRIYQNDQFLGVGSILIRNDYLYLKSKKLFIV